MSTYLYKGYKISNLGYHQPDHCVWWEAVDKNGCACFHGNTLREVEMLINDSEWEDKLKVKDAEITDLKAKNTEAFKAVLKRDALIKELADKLAQDAASACEFNDPVCDTCKFNTTCDTYKLITRAREVSNG